MKINAINSLYIRSQNKISSPDKGTNIVSSTSVQKNISNFYYMPLNIISFKGTTEDEAKLKNIPNIKCASCGQEFLQRNTYIELGANETTKTSADNIKKLAPYASKMSYIERRIFNILRKLSYKHPKENFQELLSRIYPKHLEKLQYRQKEIIEKVAEKRKSFSPANQIHLECALKAINKILFEESHSIPQKRYRAIEEFKNNFKNTILKKQEKKAYNEALSTLFLLPCSGNNIDAFIVKYAQRIPEEISRRLVKDLLPTIEHVTPVSKGGLDTINNKIILCKKCNGERKNLHYKEWAKRHPEIKKNLQIYMDKVIEEINAGRLEGLEYYPIAIQALFDKEKSGLDINIHALKPKASAKNKEKEIQIAKLRETIKQTEEEIDKITKNLSKQIRPHFIERKIEEYQYDVSISKVLLEDNNHKFKENYPTLINYVNDNSEKAPKTIIGYFKTYENLRDIQEKRKTKQDELSKKIQLLNQTAQKDEKKLQKYLNEQKNLNIKIEQEDVKINTIEEEIKDKEDIQSYIEQETVLLSQITILESKLARKQQLLRSLNEQHTNLKILKAQKIKLQNRLRELIEI